MTAKTSKLNKKKGVEICADWLYEGKARKEILKFLQENYKVSEGTVDNWIKCAKVKVADRLKEDEITRSRVNTQLIEDTAKRLNLSREQILQEYAKIAFFDIRKIYTVDGGLKAIRDLDAESAGAIAGVESFDEKEEDVVTGTARKVKIWDKRAALDSICKVLGYNAPDKSELVAKVNLSELPIIFK